MTQFLFSLRIIPFYKTLFAILIGSFFSNASDRIMMGDFSVIPLHNQRPQSLCFLKKNLSIEDSEKLKTVISCDDPTEKCFVIARHGTACNKLMALAHKTQTFTWKPLDFLLETKQTLTPIFDKIFPLPSKVNLISSLKAAVVFHLASDFYFFHCKGQNATDLAETFLRNHEGAITKHFLNKLERRKYWVISDLDDANTTLEQFLKFKAEDKQNYIVISKSFLDLNEEAAEYGLSNENASIFKVIEDLFQKFPKTTLIMDIALDLKLSLKKEQLPPSVKKLILMNTSGKLEILSDDFLTHAQLSTLAFLHMKNVQEVGHQMLIWGTFDLIDFSGLNHLETTGVNFCARCNIKEDNHAELTNLKSVGDFFLWRSAANGNLSEDYYFTLENAGYFYPPYMHVNRWASTKGKLCSLVTRAGVINPITLISLGAILQTTVGYGHVALTPFIPSTLLVFDALKKYSPLIKY